MITFGTGFSVAAPLARARVVVPRETARNRLVVVVVAAVVVVVVIARIVLILKRTRFRQSSLLVSPSSLFDSESTPRVRPHASRERPLRRLCQP